MNSTKIAVIAFSVGAVAVVLWGQIRYAQGRDDMRAEIMAQTPARDTAENSVVWHPRPDTMHGSDAGPKRPGNRVRVTGGERPPVAAADIPAGEYVDEYGGTGLAWTQTDTLVDSRGGRHMLFFTFPTLTFDEIYQPGADTARVVTVTETRFVEREPPPFWVTAFAAWPGVGVAAGYNPVGVGVMWLRDREPVPFVSYTWRF